MIAVKNHPIMAMIFMSAIIITAYSDNCTHPLFPSLVHAPAEAEHVDPIATPTDIPRAKPLEAPVVHAPAGARTGESNCNPH